MTSRSLSAKQAIAYSKQCLFAKNSRKTPTRKIMAASDKIGMLDLKESKDEDRMTVYTWELSWNTKHVHTNTRARRCILAVLILNRDNVSLASMLRAVTEELRLTTHWTSAINNSIRCNKALCVDIIILCFCCGRDTLLFISDIRWRCDDSDYAAWSSSCAR